MDVLSKQTARNFLVSYQGLNDYGALVCYDGAKSYMQKVRCIQYDPLNVVGRNPDLVLQSRIKNYNPQILTDLLYRDRTLIDGADKVMSIILQEDYLKMTRVRKSATEELLRTLSYRDSLDALNILDEVKDYIRENGPLPAGKIDIGGKAKDGRWGHKKLSSAALDYLYHSGQLGISNKLKTQKVYDLIENLLPPELLSDKDPFSDEREFLKWYVMRRIGSIGMVRNRNSGAWLGQYLIDQNLRTDIINELIDEGALIAYQIEDVKDTVYIRKEDAGYLAAACDSNTAQFIAPLDNLIWDRGLTLDIFGFDYSWEVYIPAAKRKYGYYVLPVLYKNRFIARFEPEKNNGKEPVRIKNWWWEEDVTVTDEMFDAVRDAFIRFSDYLGVEPIDERILRRTLLM